MVNHLNRKLQCINSNNNIKLIKSINNYILQGISYLEYKEIINKNKKHNKSSNIIQDASNILQTPSNILQSASNILQNDVNNKYICKYCDKSYTLNYSLSRHF